MHKVFVFVKYLKNKGIASLLREKQQIDLRNQ